MSGAEDFEARIRAMHAARAEVDQMLGFGPTAPVAPQHADAVRCLLRRAEAELVGAREARDDAADAYDVLVRRVWEAATGDTHEGPASVDVLAETVAGLRARADRADAELLALRAAVREWARHVGGATLQGATAAYLDAAAHLRALVGEG